MRVVVAPDKFKGSLTAAEAALAMADGVREAVPDAEVRLLPVSDGGEGFIAAAVTAGWTPQSAVVQGPCGDPVRAGYAVRDGAAVLEMAEASGLRLLPGGVSAPLTASTRGTGELVLAALDGGARRLVLGVGGSATTDGGAGLAQALGARLLDADGKDLPPGGAALVDLDRVDASSMDPRLAGLEVVVATDVDNPLVGSSGAAAVYGPQKGADPEDVVRLEAGLRRWALVLNRDLGADLAEVPGAGAAGGLGAGAMAFLGARQVSGIAAVLDIVGFRQALLGADLVLTGEGSLDAQSLFGKAPVGVAAAAGRARVPVVALVGRLDLHPDQVRGAGFVQVRALLELQPDVDAAVRDAAGLLTRLTCQAVLDVVYPPPGRA
ncbi:MAG: glycerate kinase [Nocardioides sp.]|nr:glycerate kinase [Nocardioides sp.]